MKLIQIGTIADRDPVTGEHYNTRPIWTEATPELEHAEKKMLNDIGKVIADEVDPATIMDFLGRQFAEYADATSGT